MIQMLVLNGPPADILASLSAADMAPPTVNDDGTVPAVVIDPAPAAVTDAVRAAASEEEKKAVHEAVGARADDAAPAFQRRDPVV